ncbi:4-amino-4-deoxy-L-arabinose transferase-like glycosyltransferase [Paenibacillus turicensis]|uniref:4-amino-4-deoxy-L-arabinose transferase-like glycosyltransferase n=1 Tax=Paenibacillus turicensis TaxID=160487 RepID=A0ABS4FSB1_9BACL|nr:glycosyltransferase family 39 protein [Paenibacillus turicensis]MBP1905469.1 4-amino-4-deoxy-L-arabinose transferase-like glycosyltransferase [Paenibacillus turicensis]
MLNLNQLNRFTSSFSKRRTLWLTLIFVVAVLLRALYVFVTGTQDFFGGDGKRYYSMIEQLANNHIYGYGSETANARVTPGFPLFGYVILTLTSFSLTAYKWVQILLGAATIIPVFYLIRSKASVGLALLGSLFVAIYPPFIFMTGIFMTETLFVFLLALFFAAWERMWRNPTLLNIIMASAILSYGILTRPSMLPVIVLAIIFLAFVREKRRSLLPFVATMVVCFLPWIIRNYVSLHEFTILASDSGNALLAGAYPYFNEPINFKEMYALGLDQTSYGLQVILEGFQANFLLYLKWFTVGKLQVLFSNMFVSDTFHFPQLYVYGGVILHYLTLLIAVPSILYWLFKRNFLAWCCSGMLAFQLLFIPTARYGTPFILLFMVLGTWAISLLLKRLWPSYSTSN